MRDAVPVEDIVAALTERSHPTITSWNRVEGRPRAADFGRSLRAEVRDALWFLARQWQVGEFRGEDAGSPVLAKVQLSTSQLARFKHGSGAASDFDDSLPLEAQVERRPVPLVVGGVAVGLDLRLLLGRRWLKLIRAIGRYEARYIQKYSFAMPDPSREDNAAVCAHSEVWQSYAAVAGRAMDGAALYFYLRGPASAGATPHAYDAIGVDVADRMTIDAAATEFIRWADELLGARPATRGESWQEGRLEYRFACSVQEPTGERVYVADEFYDGLIDWHSMDLDHRTASLGPRMQPAPAMSTVTRTMIPVPVSYAGMPNARWWAFEDQQTNFGQISPDTTDLAKLLFIEFGLIYSNDWFVVPFTLDAGSVGKVSGLAVSNVFGEWFWIEAAGSGKDAAWQQWGMFSVSTRDAVGGAAADSALLMLPTVPKVQDGMPLEEVVFIRDEMANMVWAVEKTVPAANGAGKPGGEAALENRAFLERLASPGVASDATATGHTRAKVRFELMNSVPENWIPFIPVRAKGSDRAVELQRAAMPGATTPVVPRTSLLSVGLDEIPRRAYYISEEEVPRAGIRVTQAFRRTRWYDGRVCVWFGARKETGRGEGSSGLAFDRLIATE